MVTKLPTSEKSMVPNGPRGPNRPAMGGGPSARTKGGRGPGPCSMADEPHERTENRGKKKPRAEDGAAAAPPVGDHPAVEAIVPWFRL